MRSRWSISLFRFICILWCTATLVRGYQVLISDTDNVRQVCSGMWQKFAGSREPYIEILFGPSSKGRLALVIYEWQDAKYLGVDESDRNIPNTWSTNRTYVCTLDAVVRKLCTSERLGEFIVAPGVTRESTSIWTKSVKLTPSSASDTGSTKQESQMAIGPWRYNVTRTGYYCVGAVPLTAGATPNAENIAFTSYTGVVDFQNVFKGNLPAGEYPKVVFYAILDLIYLGVGIMWSYNCYRHRTEILPVQHYISASIAFLVVELGSVSGYYKYVNDVGDPTVTHGLLVLVSILSAARNAMSFFMLLIVSLGYSIVKDSLGPLMLRIRLLAVAHFIFGVVYAVGMSVFPFESAGLWIFFMVFPLAFTLTGFMMWIMAALSQTIQNLETRKQTYKKQMFVRLHRILIGAAVVIIIFFLVSSISFSNRLQEDYAPDTWRTRWFILDGWLALLYLVCFISIAFLWRPTARNRYLAMSDELAQDEQSADDYDERRGQAAAMGADDDDHGKEWVPHEDGGDAVPLQLRRVGNDSVVFDIGDDEDENDHPHSKSRPSNGNGEAEPLRRSNSTERPPDYR
ncbi:hypothetical protein CROQUDRAFT_670677 [Cronartium quercuum f. sp. fusiforme G11]|uniref:Integral membrane protein n=1 Tax=Cronartium quercuum f. sp. fusiforme G11 TaxID=708437 RepID=A0A9P6NPK8_9BASI|nr:hypothetical protein CROQUDRAFT_670677 [Cronartium quercuum f. sp. fusiforme G11]